MVINGDYTRPGKTWTENPSHLSSANLNYFDGWAIEKMSQTVKLREGFCFGLCMCRLIMGYLGQAWDIFGKYKSDKSDKSDSGKF